MQVICPHNWNCHATFHFRYILNPETNLRTKAKVFLLLWFYLKINIFLLKPYKSNSYLPVDWYFCFCKWLNQPIGEREITHIISLWNYFCQYSLRNISISLDLVWLLFEMKFLASVCTSIHVHSKPTISDK